MNTSKNKSQELLEDSERINLGFTEEQYQQYLQLKAEYGEFYPVDIEEFHNWCKAENARRGFGWRE